MIINLKKLTIILKTYFKNLLFKTKPQLLYDQSIKPIKNIFLHYNEQNVRLYFK